MIRGGFYYFPGAGGIGKYPYYPGRERPPNFQVGMSSPPTLMIIITEIIHTRLRARILFKLWTCFLCVHFHSRNHLYFWLSGTTWSDKIWFIVTFFFFKSENNPFKKIFIKMELNGFLEFNSIEKKIQGLLVRKSFKFSFTLNIQSIKLSIIKSIN